MLDVLNINSLSPPSGVGSISPIPLGTATVAMVWHRGRDRLLRFVNTNTKRPVRSRVAIRVFKGVGNSEGRRGQK